jgi:pimeloyl-ACP methyl ester carboxylesterase
MPELDRAGVAVHYEVTGGGAGEPAQPGQPAVLLTHGFAASSRMFDKNVAAIPGRTVVTWDIRGHGASAYPEDPAAYSPELALADMAALLDTVGAERAMLVGHSLGGYLSLRFQLAHPDRVAGLVLIDTGPGYRNEQARQKWNERAERNALTLAERGVGAFNGDELAGVAHRDASGLINVARRILPQYDSAVLDGLPSIDVPVLVIVGEDDAPFVPAAQVMVARIPGARMAMVPGAGHAPNVTHPEVVNPLLAEFSQRLEGVRR